MPRKNVRVLGGKPLVARALETALAAKSLDRVVVSSDDEEVLSITREYGSQHALRRPPEISDDRAPAIDYVRHALGELEPREKVRYETIVIIQPSSPFTLPQDIDATVALLESSEADSAVSVMEVDHATHPWKLKTMAGNRLHAFLEEERGRMAAHALPTVFVRNCSVYATRRQVVEGGAIIGADCRGFVMPRERSLDINDELDFCFAQFLAERKQELS